MKNVMTIAWNIAKDGQETFGGSVKEYFREALKLAWRLVKGDRDENTVTWTNARGIKIEMRTEHITEEVIGFEQATQKDIVKKVDKIVITHLSLGGQSVDTWNTKRVGTKITTGRVVLNGQPTMIEIELPAEVIKKVWGAYDKRQAAREAAREAFAAKEAKLQAHINLSACGA